MKQYSKPTVYPIQLSQEVLVVVSDNGQTNDPAWSKEQDRPFQSGWHSEDWSK